MAFWNDAPADVLHHIFISLFAKSLPLYVMWELARDVSSMLNSTDRQEKDLSQLKGCPVGRTTTKSAERFFSTWLVDFSLSSLIVIHVVWPHCNSSQLQLCQMFLLLKDFLFFSLSFSKVILKNHVSSPHQAKHQALTLCEREIFTEKKRHIWLA